MTYMYTRVHVPSGRYIIHTCATHTCTKVPYIMFKYCAHVSMNVYTVQYSVTQYQYQYHMYTYMYQKSTQLELEVEVASREERRGNVV